MTAEKLLSDSSLIQLPDDASALPPVSAFSVEGEFSGEFDKAGIFAKTGFGEYVLDKSEKGLGIDCSQNAEKIIARITSGEGLCLEPILINAPAGALRELFLHFDGAKSSYIFDLLRVKVGKNGALKLFLLYDSGNAQRFVDLGSELGEGAKLEIFNIFAKGHSVLSRSNVTLNEENSSFREIDIAILSGKEKADLRTNVIEGAGNVKASVETRTVLKDNSRVALKGLIKVRKEAVKSDSRYGAYCLKLSPGTRADLEPDLEIEALDVKASHAASVSPVDEEKLFYLRSRGMTEELARKEISLGFLLSILKEEHLLKAVEDVV